MRAWMSGNVELPLSKKHQPFHLKRTVGLTDSTPEVFLSLPESSTFRLSLNTSFQARWIYCSESVTDLLGYEPGELVDRPSMDLVHPDELATVKSLHDASIRESKAATISYMRMRHKDAFRGYIFCSVMRTIVSDVVVGSVSFAESEAKMARNDSTAQEISIITPEDQNLEYRKWTEPPPWSHRNIRSPIPESLTARGNTSTTTANDRKDTTHINTNRLLDSSAIPSQRVALILDRFSSSCPINFATSKSLFFDDVDKFSLFDFVAARDEEKVQGWINQVKAWGVNDSGQPSDGGFGFGKFTLCRSRRESRRSSMTRADRLSRRKSVPNVTASSSGRNSRERARRSQQVKTNGGDEILVEAIFSAHSDGLIVILCPLIS